jgi:hypothetical protein
MMEEEAEEEAPVVVQKDGSISCLDAPEVEVHAAPALQVLVCYKAIEEMDRRLRGAELSANAKLNESVTETLDGILRC